MLCIYIYIHRKVKNGPKEKWEQWYIDETLWGSVEKSAEIFPKSQEDLSVWQYERKGKEAEDGNSHWGALVCFWDWIPPTDGYWPEGRTCCYPHRLFLPITIFFVCLHVSLFSGPSAHSLHPLHHPSTASFLTSTDCLYLDCFVCKHVEGLATLGIQLRDKGQRQTKVIPSLTRS